jgi:hypothetical protein
MAPTATQTRTADRLVEGVREGSSAWIDVLREGNNRTYRWNRLLLDEAQRTQEETAEMIGRFVKGPTDLRDFTGSIIDTWRERSRRRSDLARTIFGDVREAVTETRRLLGRAADAGRETMSATANIGREAAGGVARRASEGAESVSQATDGLAKDLRRQARRANRADEGERETGE